MRSVSRMEPEEETKPKPNQTINIIKIKAR